MCKWHENTSIPLKDLTDEELCRLEVEDFKYNELMIE